MERRVEELLELIGLDPELGTGTPPSSRAASSNGWGLRLAADPPVMLMDEPFGAIDLINRERLQNEFLRLQAEIRKTAFVTHDIDEAIKMGDRIAISCSRAGASPKYATPAELLMASRRRLRRGLRPGPTAPSSAWR